MLADTARGLRRAIHKKDMGMRLGVAGLAPHPLSLRLGENVSGIRRIPVPTMAARAAVFNVRVREFFS